MKLGIGAFVVYGSNGVCKVVDRRTEVFGDQKRVYYVLKPVYDDKSTFYVPAENEAVLQKMKRVLSPLEIKALIRSMPARETIWVGDDRARGERYKAILSEGSREEILQVLKTLYERKQELSAQGKKLRAADETLLQRAESILHDEFALVLNIEREEVLPFILGQIEAQTEPAQEIKGA